MRIYVFLYYKIKMINNLILNMEYLLLLIGLIIIILNMEYLLLLIGLIIIIVLYNKHNDDDFFNEN